LRRIINRDGHSTCGRKHAAASVDAHISVRSIDAAAERARGATQRRQTVGAGFHRSVEAFHATAMALKRSREPTNCSNPAGGNVSGLGGGRRVFRRSATVCRCRLSLVRLHRTDGLPRKGHQNLLRLRCPAPFFAVASASCFSDLIGRHQANPTQRLARHRAFALSRRL
jgi:hypothetical protein